MRYLVHRYRRSPQFQHRRRRRFAHRLVPHQHADRDPAHRRSSPAHPYAVLVAHDVARPPQVGGVDLTGGRRIPLPRQPAAQRPQSNHGAQVGGGCGSRFPVERHPGRLADLHLSRIHFQPQQAHAFPGRVSEREQDIYRWHRGFKTGMAVACEEIGRRCGISSEDVKGIISRVESLCFG